MTDRAALADVFCVLQIAERATMPWYDEDPFVGLSGMEDGATPVALDKAADDGALLGALDAAVALELISPQRRRELLALRERLEGDDEDDEPAGADALPRVRAVLPGPTPWRDGLRVLSVACYEDSVDVRWEWMRPLSGEPGVADRDVRARIADDVGTEYTGAGGGGTGWRPAEGTWLSAGHDAVRPGIPAAARTLTVSVGGTRIELDVTGVGERPAT